jgi:hypothetical protein
MSIREHKRKERERVFLERQRRVAGLGEKKIKVES